MANTRVSWSVGLLLQLSSTLTHSTGGGNGSTSESFPERETIIMMLKTHIKVTEYNTPQTHATTPRHTVLYLRHGKEDIK